MVEVVVLVVQVVVLVLVVVLVVVVLVVVVVKQRESRTSPLHMLYDSNKIDYKDGHRQIYAYYKMVQFIISARDENVEHDTQHH